LGRANCLKEDASFVRTTTVLWTPETDKKIREKGPLEKHALPAKTYRIEGENKKTKRTEEMEESLKKREKGCPTRSRK